MYTDFMLQSVMGSAGAKLPSKRQLPFIKQLKLVPWKLIKKPHSLGSAFLPHFAFW